MAELDYDLQEAGYNCNNNVQFFTPFRVKNNIYICGFCHGVILKRRGENDCHICIEYIVFDDGFWYKNSENDTSSAWIPEIITILSIAQNYMQQMCIPSGVNKNGRHYGYEFRK